MFLQSYTLLKYLCAIVQFLLNTLIIVTIYFSVQRPFFVIAIIMSEFDNLILRKLRYSRFVRDCSVFTQYSYYPDYFVYGQHHVFVISIIKNECAILILQQSWLGLFHSCYYLLLYNDSVILSCFILKLPMVQ